MSCPQCADIPDEAKERIRARISSLQPGETAAIVLRLDVVVSREGVLRVDARPDLGERYSVVRPR